MPPQGLTLNLKRSRSLDRRPFAVSVVRYRNLTLVHQIFGATPSRGRESLGALDDDGCMWEYRAR